MIRPWSRLSPRSRQFLAGFMAMAGLLGGCASPDTLSPFSTDGCSRFPDGSVLNGKKDWGHCCISHDRAYWRGGTADDRLKADEALRTRVQESTGNAMLATMMYKGVRIGGSPYWPTRFRWGYGWGYGRKYRSLTPAESAAADQREAEYEAEAARQTRRRI